jgi:16S rRNA U1498 N3-methylase RsmE
LVQKEISQKKRLEKALSLEFDPISLGKNRLRTETAGLYACVLQKKF